MLWFWGSFKLHSPGSSVLSRVFVQIYLSYGFTRLHKCRQVFSAGNLFNCQWLTRCRPLKTRISCQISISFLKPESWARFLARLIHDTGSHVKMLATDNSLLGKKFQSTRCRKGQTHLQGVVFNCAMQKWASLLVINPQGSWMSVYRGSHESSPWKIINICYSWLWKNWIAKFISPFYWESLMRKFPD